MLTEKAGTVLYWLAWRSHYEPEKRISFEKQVILNIHDQIILIFFFKWWNFNDCWMDMTNFNLIKNTQLFQRTNYKTILFSPNNFWMDSSIMIHCDVAASVLYVIFDKNYSVFNAVTLSCKLYTKGQLISECLQISQKANQFFYRFLP